MADTINLVQEALTDELETLLAGETLKIYEYRTIPLKLNLAMMVTYLGGQPGNGVMDDASEYTYLDFAIIMLALYAEAETAAAKEAAKKAAETTLNRIEWDIFESPPENALWEDVSFPGRQFGHRHQKKYLIAGMAKFISESIYDFVIYRRNSNG